MSKKHQKRPTLVEVNAEFERIMRPFMEQTGQEWLEITNGNFWDALALQGKILAGLANDNISESKAHEIEKLVLNVIRRTEPQMYVRGEKFGDEWGVVVMDEHDGRAETLKVWSSFFGPARAVTIEGEDMVWAVREAANLFVPIIAVARAGAPRGISDREEIRRGHMPWVYQFKELTAIEALAAAA
jgi:hypothetical protein